MCWAQSGGEQEADPAVGRRTPSRWQGGYPKYPLLVQDLVKEQRHLTVPILCVQVLKENSWTSESDEQEDKDANEEAHLRIMEWAKELQKATQVRRVKRKVQ